MSHSIQAVIIIYTADDDPRSLFEPVVKFRHIIFMNAAPVLYTLETSLAGFYVHVRKAYHFKRLF
jgi:hypothetical protein